VTTLSREANLSPVWMYLLGGSGTSNDDLHIDIASLKAGGQARFVERDLLPEIERSGALRVWLKLPGGCVRYPELTDHDDRNQMQFTAMATAQERGVSWAYEGFVKALTPVRDLLESRGGELGVYMGALKYDTRLKALLPPEPCEFYQDQIARENPAINMAVIHSQRELQAFSCMGIDSLHDLPTKLYRDMDVPHRMMPLKQWPVRIAEKISNTLKRGGRNRRGKVFREPWPNLSDFQAFCAGDDGIYMSNNNRAFWAAEWPEWCLNPDVMGERDVIIESDKPAGELAARDGCQEGLKAFIGATWDNQKDWIREYAMWVRSRGWTITVSGWDMKRLGLRREDFEGGMTT